MSGCAECLRSPNGFKACRILWNCPIYKDEWLRRYRLEYKIYNFKEWYTEQFRSDVCLSEVYGNG